MTTTLGITPPGAAGLGATTPKPTMAYAGYGQFTITNWAATLQYNLSVTAGTISRSGSLITLSAASAIASIAARAPKGIPVSAAAVVERLAHSYTPDTRYSYDCSYTTYDWCSCGCECGGGGCGCYGSAAQSFGQCGCPAVMCWYNWCGTYHSATCTGGSAPVLIDAPGYTNGGSEWYKIS